MDRAAEGLPPIAEAFEHAPCGLLTATAQGSIVRVNATFCRWLGYEAAELLAGRRFQDLLTIGGKVFHQTHLAPLLQMQRSIAEVKMDFVHKDGKPIPMLINGSRRRHSSMEFDDFAVLVVVDRHQYERELLTARRQAEVSLEEKQAAEAALKDADRRKNEFIATLAHELRNPLAPVKTILELLHHKVFDDPQVEWARAVLERQVAQMSSLVDGLLDVSRINEGKILLSKKRLNLASVVKHAVEASMCVIEASSHRFHLELATEPIMVEADAIRLSQIIQNLLNNAAKYTPDGGRISLVSKREEHDAVVSVLDTGIGIGPEHLSSLFEMFSQLEPGSERAQGGLGIGLSLVRTLAELHGGSVAVVSKGAGQGSEFTVRLPLSSDQSPLGDERRALARPPPQAPRRVLVVDDNQDAAISLAMLLEAEGDIVATAFTGCEGLRMVDDFVADVVILDIGLPDRSGYDIARSIRQQQRARKMLLIALTGWGQEQDRQAAEIAGFDFHFTKPVDLDRLMAVLHPRVTGSAQDY